MKILVIFCLAGLFTVQAGSQTAPAGPASTADAHSPDTASPLASGAVLSTELSKSLDTKKSKANDRVEVRTATDLLAHGRIVLPRNTKVVGHVTDAKAHTKTSPDSRLAITFDRMLMKDGHEVSLKATIQAVGRPLLMTPPPAAGEISSADNPSRLPQVAPVTRSGTAVNTGAIPSHPGDLDPGSNDPMTISSTVSPLDSTSHGVIGFEAVTLQTSDLVSVLSSGKENIHLDTGTQLILHVE